MTEQKEENELLKIWKYQLYNGYVSYRRFFRGNILSFWQQKAKMDNLENIKECMDNMEKHYSNILMEKNEIIADQKKQIIGFAKDNALLHKRLKKCQEELKEVEEARAIKVEIPDSWIIKDKGEKRG